MWILVERFSVPGQRRDRYRLRDDAWTSMLKQDITAAQQLRALADDGLEVVGSQPPAAQARLALGGAVVGRRGGGVRAVCGDDRGFGVAGRS